MPAIPKLPLEIIQKILSIKHFTETKDRLETILEFPKLEEQDCKEPCEFYFSCGSHQWLVHWEEPELYYNVQTYEEYLEDLEWLEENEDEEEGEPERQWRTIYYTFTVYSCFNVRKYYYSVDLNDEEVTYNESEHHYDPETGQEWSDCDNGWDNQYRPGQTLMYEDLWFD